jgi:hypothetical protein
MGRINRLLRPIAALGLVSCGCKDVALNRVTPSDQTIHVGQAIVLSYATGGGCRDGGGLTDVSLHDAPTVWHTHDTLVITLDTISGRVLGRMVGDAQVFSGGGSSAAIHVR